MAKKTGTTGFCGALTKAILEIKYGLTTEAAWEKPYPNKEENSYFDEVWSYVTKNVNGSGKDFLEIKAYRPQNYQGTMYWWGDQSSSRRIEILNKIISGMES